MAASVDLAQTQQAGGPAPASLPEWVEWLRDKEMPVFSRTVRRLNQALEDERAGILEMSRIILEDPALTAKLLKLGNSPYYNPSRQPLGTITRAIVMIGLNVIHELALACSFIDALLSRRNHRQLHQEIARSLHAAAQAKSFAHAMGDAAPEEVFIAALLQNIGQLAFWCFEQQQGVEIDRRVEQPPGCAREKAEREVLGFRLDQLGAALCKTWSLGGLTEKCFSGAASPRVSLIKHSCHLVRLIEQLGWEAQPVQVCMEKLAETTGKPLAEIQARARLNAENAAKLAEQFGAQQAAQYIPRAEDPRASSPAPKPPENPQTLLLQIMGDIGNLLSGDIDLNMVFETIMEGIYRALEMDRVMFALMTPDRRFLKEKSALGWPASKPRESLPLAVNPPNLFSWALDRNEALWARKGQEALYTQSLRAYLGYPECLIAPISLNRRAIGLFHADRAASQRPLTQEVFDNFRQITQQANIALRLSQLQHS